jgi:RecA/RadA recombinase
MAKKLLKTRNHAELMMGVLSENQERDVCVASRLADSWKYIDFWNPALGTPSLAMEYLFGSRGVLGGRLMKLEAPYGVGKSSFMFYIYGCGQHACDAWCYHVESEAAPPPPDFIAGFGCDTSNLTIDQPKTLELCIDGMDTIVCSIRGGFGGLMGESGKVSKTKFTDPFDPDKDSQIILGVDSLSGLGLDAISDLDVIDAAKTSAIAKYAKLLREYFRNRMLRWKQTDTLVILATQQTAKINTTNTPQPADKKITTLGGDVIGYHSTYILDMKSSRYVDAKGVNIGDKITIKTTKNKVSDKNKEITLFLVRNHGFDITATDVEFFVSHPASPFAEGTVKRYQGGIICKQLSDKRFETEADFLKALYENKELVQALREGMRIRGFDFEFEHRYKLPNPDAPEAEPEPVIPEIEGTPVPAPVVAKGAKHGVERGSSGILDA